MLKQFSNWYFDYGWIILTVLSGATFDVISMYNKNSKLRYMIIATIVSMIIIGFAVAGKSN